MAQYAATSSVTNIYREPNVDSDLLGQINSENNVAGIEHGLLFSRIIYNTYEGFCETRNLNFENGSDLEKERDSQVMISVPRECAVALYNSLKFSLKT